MREIKFRAWDKDRNKMFDVQAIYFYKDKTIVSMPVKIEGFEQLCIEKTNVELMQCTGLKDGTKWEQLTEQERFDFYIKNESEDGVSIKYQNVDDVKHLWEGKEIYEGDIIQEKQGSSFIVKFGEFIIIEYDERQYGYYAEEIDKTENEIGLTGKFPIFKWGCAQSSIIGNIYENPELLEVVE